MVLIKWPKWSQPLLQKLARNIGIVNRDILIKEYHKSLQGQEYSVRRRVLLDLSQADLRRLPTWGIASGCPFHREPHHISCQIALKLSDTRVNFTRKP